MDTGSKVAIGVVLGVATAIVAAGVAEHYVHAGPSNALQAAAQALLSVNPCLQSSEPQVRAFQAQAIAANYLTGLTQDDGRYGSETRRRWPKWVGTSAPPACTAQSWWGAPGTTVNP